nr:MAG TPA: hypothetical protein [Caudoviricetes sp.]
MTVSHFTHVMMETGTLHINIPVGLTEIWTMGPGIWFDMRGTHFLKLFGLYVISGQKNFILIKGALKYEYIGHTRYYGFTSYLDKQRV